MTLFSLISENEMFNDVLVQYYDGEKDLKTVNLLN